VSGYHIEPEPEAESQLAAIWALAGSLRAAVTRAQDSAERKLTNDPVGFGRHLGEGLYRLNAPPLVIYYTIHPAERLVKITEIHCPAVSP
jgi:hypothetical protein